MTSYVENESGITFDFDIEELALRIENQVLNMEQCPYEAQINLLVTDLDGIQEINKAFRNLDQPMTCFLSRPFHLLRNRIFQLWRSGNRIILIRKAESFC